MRKLLPLLLLLTFAPSALADRISAEITFTNTPANGSNLVVNASTRSWITVVTVPASQIAVTNNVPNSVTNLFRHLLSSPLASIQPVLTATNKITLHGANGLAMSVALNSDWGTVTYSTQTVSGVKIAVVVPGSDFASDVRQKMFSMLTTSLNDYATSPVVSGSVFAQALMGLTNNQTVAGAKILTNAANIWQDGLITNAQLRGLQMHYYPSNGGIYGFTSGLDPSTVLAVDASGYFGIYAVNAVMGEPLDTPLNIAPLPASILNMLSASNRFGGLAWSNYFTGTNRFAAIWDSNFKNGTGTNMTWNGGTGNTQTLVNPFITGNLGIGLSPMAHPASLDKGQTLTNGTAASADPVNGFSFWSSGGEWFYRSSTTSEGAGANNRIHNRAAEATGSGADYSLTTSFALASFGGTQAEFNTLPTAGTYEVSAIVTITSGSEAGDDFRATLFNTTDGAVVANSEKRNSTIAENSTDTIPLKSIITITAPKRIQIYSRNATAARGTVSSIFTTIYYVRLY